MYGIACGTKKSFPGTFNMGVNDTDVTSVIQRSGILCLLEFSPVVSYLPPYGASFHV